MNQIERFDRRYSERFRKAVRTALATAQGYGDLIDQDGQEAVRLLGRELIEEIQNACSGKEAMGRRLPGSVHN